MSTNTSDDIYTDGDTPLVYKIANLAIEMRENYDLGNSIEFVNSLRIMKRNVDKLLSKYKGDLDA